MITAATSDTPVRNSDTFLAIFADVEKWLRGVAGVDRGVPFVQAVDRVAAKNAAVRRYRDDLKEFADLRNAIVHERGDGHVIAEPNERALADFQRIRNALVNPPKVVPLFQREVKSRDEGDSVGLAVGDMRAGSFSQLPVVKDGSVVALLTAETVVRWLASEIANDVVSLMDTSISNVLSHVEDNENYSLISRTATLHEVVAQFEISASKGKTLDAVLVTDAARPDQKLLGILTVYDLPEILNALGLRRWTVA